MTPEPTTTEGPAQPDNITPINVPVDGGTPPPPTPEQIEAARKAVEDDMRDAIPFNRLAVHTSFQRAIQAAITEGKDIGKIDRLTSAFRAWAEGEYRLSVE